jgi:uncharacterized protein YndB with AHSA1/START domain
MTRLSVLATLVVCFGLVHAPACGQPGASDPLWEGKVDTGRAINIDLTVDMPPEEVYRLWTTYDGIRTFFAPAIHLDLEVGGRYEIVFDPINDPQGMKIGSHGARILRLVPDKEIAFDFTFPPLGPELNTKPFPTWVEVRFDPVPGEPGKTKVRFAHLGWPSSEAWDKALVMFRDDNWPLVLRRLETYCRERQPHTWASDKKRAQPQGGPGQS